KDLAAVGAAITVMPVVVTALLTCCRPDMLAPALLYGPPTMFEVTSTVTTHEAWPADIVAPVIVIVAPDAATTPVPDGHVVVTFGGPATTTFAGSVSVKLMPPCAGLPAPVLVIVNVRVEVPPCAIVVGEKALLSVGCVMMSAWLVTPLAR